MIRHVSVPSTVYDMMDEYYYLASEVTKEEFLNFIAPIARHMGPTIQRLDKALVDKLTKCSHYEPAYDIVGGFFGVLGMSRQDFYKDWLPEDLQRCLIKDKTLTQRRLDWVHSQIKELPPDKAVEYLKNGVYYDDDGGFIWTEDDDGGIIKIADLRGRGHLTGYLGLSEQEATDLQDDVGKFIVDAINEKINDYN